MARPRLHDAWALCTARPLLIAAITLPLAVFVAAGAFDFRAEKQQVRHQALATATALAEHAQTVVETTELVLARVLDRVAGMDWAMIPSSPALHDFLMKLREDLPQIDSVFLVSPEGENVASTRSFPLADPFSTAERDFYKVARAGNFGPFVSTPFLGRSGQGLTFTLTQARVSNGAFDGLAGVTISPTYFQQFYAQAMDYPGQSTTTLVREDGTIMLRYPGSGTSNGRLSEKSVFMRAMATSGRGGEFEGRSTIDGRWRLGVYRRLRNQPLYVSYSVNAEAYLAPWRRNLLLIGGFSAMLAISLLIVERVQQRRAIADKRAADALLLEVERRRNAELALEQMQKMEALGRLSGGVAHDFNNLLTAILGPLELAIKRSTDTRVLRLLNGAMQAAQRGAKLTARMLAVTRQRGAAAVTLDPNAVIRELGDMIARTIGPMIELTYDLDPAATPILAEMVQLETTLINLCVNSRDAMPQGGSLLLRTRAVVVAPGSSGLPHGDYVEIAVADTGEGMTEETRARAFEPFFTTKEPGKGTGLGLSTTYGFVQSAGGTVAVASTPGQGTTVTLTLPRAHGQPEALPQPRPTVSGRMFDILLVDDDSAVRTVTRELLEEAGHDVVEAGSGAEALDILRLNKTFDLLVTDFAMPGIDGGQLAAAVRRLLPHLPILFVTGYAKGDALASWERAGSWTLEKPFTGAQLARAVQDAMAQVQTGVA